MSAYPTDHNAFNTHLQGYYAAAQRIYQEANPSLANYDEWELQHLKKYVRILHRKSAHSFVDITTGDIFKPSGWTRPAKHARGNIFTPDNGASCLGPYGPHYLR